MPSAACLKKKCCLKSPWDLDVFGLIRQAWDYSVWLQVWGQACLSWKHNHWMTFIMWTKRKNIIRIHFTTVISHLYTLAVHLIARWSQVSLASSWHWSFEQQQLNGGLGKGVGAASGVSATRLRRPAGWISSANYRWLLRPGVLATKMVTWLRLTASQKESGQARGSWSQDSNQNKVQTNLRLVFTQASSSQGINQTAPKTPDPSIGISRVGRPIHPVQLRWETPEGSIHHVCMGSWSQQDRS